MIKQTYQQDLTPWNTFGMHVTAKYFIEYDSVADLLDIDFEELAKPILHIGGGSNLLFTGDFNGTILHSKIDFIEEIKEGLFSVGAGVVFDEFCEWAADEGLWGIENLSNIPGEVGASAVQNIGAYGVEVKDVIKTVYCYDIQEEEFVSFDVEDCEYGYRDSFFKRPENKGRYIITHVVFALSEDAGPNLSYGHLKEAVEKKLAKLSSKQDPDIGLAVGIATGLQTDIGTALAISQTISSNKNLKVSPKITPHIVREAIIEIRKDKLPDPRVIGSAGSFFKNPVVPKDVFLRIEKATKAELGEDYKVPHYDLEDGTVKIPAAWLIEQCGWKGRRSGGAAVYEHQPLVIVNYTGEAFPEEILALEKKILTSVQTKFGITLHPEVEHV